MRKPVLSTPFSTPSISTDVIWQEAEHFDSAGKWSNDSQHMDIMGSPYLLATGVGKPVDDAVTTVKTVRKGKYTLWVRCRDWLPSHSPGQFQVLVNGKASTVTFGKSDNDRWQWINGGKFELAEGKTELRLQDTTGWWGRCDAIVLAKGFFRPAEDRKGLEKQRLKYGGVSHAIKDMGSFDVVVVGGGPAGMGAAIAAARNGIKVAFIQDRPVLGGNSSSEIQVPPMGYIGKPPDLRNVTGITEELFPQQGWSNFANSDHMEKIVQAEKNISLYFNTRGVAVEMDPSTISTNSEQIGSGQAGKTRIDSVIGQDVLSGQRMRFRAPLFIDSTGHGWIGYYAGAEWRMGQEARGEFNESLAPVEAGKRGMGNTLYKAIITERKNPAPFECPDWAYQWESSDDFEKIGSHLRRDDTVRPENFDGPSRGRGRNPGNDLDGALTHTWWVEYGGIKNTIDDAEQIRDELFRISIGLWSYSKNQNPATEKENANCELVWLNYVPGVRESRRLVGDYILSQQDYDKRIVHDDTIAFTDWGPDCHHPEGFWVKGNDCIHTYKGLRTSIPYRTLYSKNIENLLIAGRCHSATHIAFGGTRVMRPMCATGQAAGTAAAIATKHKTLPRGVYQNHIEELQDTLIKDGCRLMNKTGGMREPPTRPGMKTGITTPSATLSLTDTAQADFSMTGTLSERYRPQFHYTTIKGWINDPCGLVYYKGEYHIFNDHNVASCGFPGGKMNGEQSHWSHAISKDLVHWQHMPIAVYPDKLGACWSGSGVVDWKNTAEFQKGKETPLVLAYTSAGNTLGQSLTFSNDRGRTWKKYEGNPVVKQIAGGNRDPQVFWHEPTKKWVMVLYVTRGKVHFLNSDDLKEWTATSVVSLNGFYECPDLFELPVDGDKKIMKWVLYDARFQYWIGQFDGKTFKPEAGPFRGDHGNNFYAAQSWHNTESRRIQIGWMSRGQYPGMSFNQQMSFPCELTLRTTAKGIRLFRYPVNEIESLYTKPFTLKDHTLKPGDNPLADISGDLFDIRMEIEHGNATEFGIRLHETVIAYANGKVASLGSKTGVSPVDGRLALRILIDRTSIEMFVNDGDVSLSSCFLPKKQSTGLELYTKGGDAKIRLLKVTKLKSSWSSHKAAAKQEG